MFSYYVLILWFLGLDYESQQSYTLTFEARDGGGRVSAVSLVIELEDVNDNRPRFDQSDYSRIVREGATSFEPQLFVKVFMNNIIQHLITLQSNII